MYRSPRGKFHFRAPTNSLLPPRAKWVSGDCRRENCPVCAEETFAVNAAIDLIGPL